MFFKKTKARTFDDVLASLRAQGLDVAQAAGVSGGYRVSKDGCAAVIAPSKAKDEKAVPAPGAAEIVERSGVVLNGEIARLLDRGYQKFFKTAKLEIVATADHLRALHNFQAALDEATGATMLYNESLGTTSDTYQYDRVAGREHHGH